MKWSLFEDKNIHVFKKANPRYHSWNFFIALAYHFCLAVLAAFTQPGGHLLADPCTPYPFFACAFQPRNEASTTCPCHYRKRNRH